MADALCGPSNALQSFQKHTQADRTLQQDRLTGLRRSPLQGFRSYDARTASLDAEFEAFAARPSDPFGAHQQFPNTPLNGALAFAQDAGHPPGWATDFQKLQIADQPIPTQHFRSEAPLMRSNVGDGIDGWHYEFMKQHQKGVTSVSQGNQAVISARADGLLNQNGFAPRYFGSEQPHFNVPSTVQAPSRHQQQDPGHGVPIYDEAAFETAFAEAAMESLAENPYGRVATPRQYVSHGVFRDEHGNLTTDRFTSREASITELGGTDFDLKGTYKTENESLFTPQSSLPPNSIAIGADRIPQEQIAPQDPKAADDLARTAAQLLTSVSHDTSSKFQNSQFLNLMRRIRDREVAVQDDDFRETGLTASTEPATAATTASSFHDDDYEAMQAAQDQNSQAAFENGSHDSDTSFGDSERDGRHDLHPGGRMYPPDSSPYQAMFGGITAEEMEAFDRPSESAILASRYQKPSVADSTVSGGST